MGKYYTFIGPIAAGKGTQAEIISKKYGLLHLSTGQIFRDAISSGSELGQKVKVIIDSGFLVPDNLTNEIVKDMRGNAAACLSMDGDAGHRNGSAFPATGG